MRRLILGLCVLALVACSGGKGAKVPTRDVGGYAALRWAPGKASYVITSKTVRQGQQGLTDFIDTFGALGDVGAAEFSQALRELLLVDPLSPENMTQIGVDLDGGFLMFSEDINPTIVTHLAAPNLFAEFVAKQNLKRTSVVVEGTEVFTASVDEDIKVSWAVADSWLWVHFAIRGIPDDGTWFSHSRKPSSAQWELPKTGEQVVGFIDSRHFLAMAEKIPMFAPCTELGSTLGPITLAMSGDPKKANARVAIEVGTAAASIDRALLPVPEGWSTSTQQVPIAAQLNLDLAAAKDRITPCMQVLGISLKQLDEMGIRSARGFIRSFDPDNKVGSGAVALDISHKDFFAAQLDQIPMRSALERKRTFGPYAGKSLSIPMFLTVDYVLTDQLALAGVGDGLLAVLVGKGGSAKGPVLEIAVQPQGLSTESWIELLRLADIRNAKRVAERLQRWSEARVNLTVEATHLVLTASGTRR